MVMRAMVGVEFDGRCRTYECSMMNLGLCVITLASSSLAIRIMTRTLQPLAYLLS